jgi:DNA transposition AAA+ family ATPase
MGAIIGPSGVSKTLTAKRYQERKQGVSLVTVDPTKKTLTSILRAISCQAGIGVGGMSSDECLDRLIERFRDTDRLLIIDEAHFLNWEAFEVIRTIHDQAGIGICYMGMPRLYSQMRGGKGYLWDQILSRISFGRGISRIEKEDVKIITDSIHPGLQKNCLNYLHEIAQKPGRLRVMVKVLERAVEACKAEKTPITLDLLKRIKSILII